MKLLTKLGLRDIGTLTDKEIEARVALDQQLRSKERKKAQVKYGKKGSNKGKPKVPMQGV